MELKDQVPEEIRTQNRQYPDESGRLDLSSPLAVVKGADRNYEGSGPLKCGFAREKIEALNLCNSDKDMGTPILGRLEGPPTDMPLVRQFWRDETAIMRRWSPRPSDGSLENDIMNGSPSNATPFNGLMAPLNKSKHSKGFDSPNQVITSCTGREIGKSSRMRSLGVPTPRHYRSPKFKSILSAVAEE